MDFRLSPEEERTLETYDSIAAEWGISRSKQDLWKAEAEVFVSGLAGNKIIDVGCGNRRAAILLYGL